MQSSLGISITDKLIRYAKVNKNNDKFDVESYGIKFYSNLEETIAQIITETNSKNIPISSEVLNENYYYFNIFNLTNKSYAVKAINTEFESFCVENHLNKAMYDGKYIYSKNLDNQDQSRIIYIYDNQTDIAERNSYFNGYRLDTLVPMPTTLPNLINAEKGKNSMIINIEDKTTVTTIVDQSIYNINVIEEGMKEIIDRINEKENSYSKSYEVCKNTTIYTMETDYSSAQGNEYLKYIVPTLFKITEEVRKLVDQYKRIDNIYITGMGSVINNIDLYFKEYFKDIKVEILKPYFLENQGNVNIKDYIEVNSAIALAMQGLGRGIKSLNFLERDWKENLKTLLSSDISTLRANRKQTKGSTPKKKFKLNLNTDMSGKFDKIEMMILRNIISAIIILIIYSIASVILVNQINNKIDEATEVKKYTSKQITLANNDDSKILERTGDYKTYSTNLENSASIMESRRSRKNQITTLLNKLVYNIPDEVTLTEIDNSEKTDGSSTLQHITIKAQSSRYEQLAYFKAKLKNANILDNIVSTEGQKEGDSIKITIEGDLRLY